MSKTPEHQKSAECSKFAKLAIGELLENRAVTDEYNIVMAGIMDDRHNIALLIPKKYEFANDDPKIKAGRLPPGSLIVDPWARALGHSPEISLAVTPEKFHFYGSLPGVNIHYQSKHDATVETYHQNKALAAAQGPLVGVQLGAAHDSPVDQREARRLDRARKAEAERDVLAGRPSSAPARSSAPAASAAAASVDEVRPGSAPARGISNSNALAALLAAGPPSRRITPPGAAPVQDPAPSAPSPREIRDEAPLHAAPGVAAAAPEAQASSSWALPSVWTMLTITAGVLGAGIAAASQLLQSNKDDISPRP